MVIELERGQKIAAGLLDKLEALIGHRACREDRMEEGWTSRILGHKKNIIRRT